MVCTSNAQNLKRNDDNGHSCIDITVVCTSNAYDSKRNKGNSPHSCIDITVVCTSNAYGSKWNNDSSHSYIDISRGVYVKCVWFEVE